MFPQTTFFSLCTQKNYPVRDRNRSQSHRVSRAFIASSAGLVVQPYFLYNFSCISYTFWRICSIFEISGFWWSQIYFFYHIISVCKHTFPWSPELRTDQNLLYLVSFTRIAWSFFLLPFLSTKVSEYCSPYQICNETSCINCWIYKKKNGANKNCHPANKNKK